VASPQWSSGGIVVVPLNVSGALRLNGPLKFSGSTTGDGLLHVLLTRFRNASSGELSRTILMFAEVEAVIVEFGEPGAIARGQRTRATSSHRIVNARAAAASRARRVRRETARL
jgi:hypothetical protein